MLVFQCFPSTALMQWGSCHNGQNNFACFFHSSSVGCGNSVGHSLFQMASQVDMIIDYSAEIKNAWIHTFTFTQILFTCIYRCLNTWCSLHVSAVSFLLPEGLSSGPGPGTVQPDALSSFTDCSYEHVAFISATLSFLRNANFIISSYLTQSRHCCMQQGIASGSPFSLIHMAVALLHRRLWSPSVGTLPRKLRMDWGRISRWTSKIFYSSPWSQTRLCSSRNGRWEVSRPW